MPLLPPTALPAKAATEDVDPEVGAIVLNKLMTLDLRARAATVPALPPMVLSDPWKTHEVVYTELDMPHWDGPPEDFSFLDIATCTYISDISDHVELGRSDQIATFIAGMAKN